jgi:beta-glucanase (GH16 family)
LLVLLLAACDNPTDSNEPSWNLIWQDEFNGPANQASQSSKWGYDIGTNWGNDQLEYDTDRTSNVSLDGNGYLAIVARKENYLGQEYTSARIVTRDLFEPTYGRFEARIKLPIGQGIWPAFWMLGANIETVGWPQCGEIDIMEYLGQEPNIVHGSLHGPGYSGGQPITRSMSLGNGRFSDGFHVFAIEWRSNSIKWFVDDFNYHTVNLGQQNGEWVFNHPFYIILNVAVGGNWVGPPDASTVFPQTMLVDWVRVYREEF